MRRPDSDSRSRERFESQVRAEDLSKFKAHETRVDTRMFTCSRCNNLFEERSVHCPKCNSRTMGEIKYIRESNREKFREQSISKIRRNL